jgi:hypothetical protein
MNRLLPLAAVLLALALTASPAMAKSPPKGNYGCSYTTLSGTFYAGTLNILSKSKYSVNKKKKGSYKTRRKKITFKTGDYRTLYFGKWSKVKNVLDSGYSYKIELFGKKDKEQKLTCTRSS